MKHDFLDRYATLDSPLHRRDPRAKIVAAMAAILCVASEPRGEIAAYALYAVLAIAAAAVSRLPPSLFAQRLLLVAPFVAAAGALLPLSAVLAGDLSPVADPHTSLRLVGSLVLRALCAVLLLTLLASSTRFTDLLWGLRRLGMPGLIGVVSALMYRYAFILTDELLRTTMARVSRTPGGLVTSRVSAYGAQAATVFVRGWERAQRVHGAMLARGFDGEYRGLSGHKFGLADGFLVALSLVSFAAVRFLA